MTTSYVSTRGGVPEMSFLDAAMAGLASDGGLLVPNHLPHLRQFEGEGYLEFAYHVLGHFAPDIALPDLWSICQSVYAPTKFCNTMDGDDSDDIVPVRKLADNLYLLRLSNGPTLAFKDLAMQLLGAVFEYRLAKTKGVLNILGSTSGDTGSAANYAMLGRQGIKVFMLSPESNMSAFQAAQMWGIKDPNIFNLTVLNFDVGQRIVKGVSENLDFKQRYSIGTINSINWVRIVAQVVYWAWAGHKINGLSAQFDVAVPTGNFGNICAAYIAKMMGVPIRRLILVTNENDVLARFFQTGIYQPPKEMVSTTSPSMDITMASNFERYVYYLLGKDTVRVKALWKELGETGRFDLSAEMPQIKASGIVATSINSGLGRNTIKLAYDRYGIVIDPHTATAMAAAWSFAQLGVPLVVAETAQPCKFDETVMAALGRLAPRPPAFVGMESKALFRTAVGPTPEAVMEFIKANT